MAREVALTHREKWDGSGYHLGLEGKSIPITERIVAIVDVFDALRSWRPYKPPYPADNAFEIIRDSAGKQFDPDLANLLLKHTAEALQAH